MDRDGFGSNFVIKHDRITTGLTTAFTAGAASGSVGLRFARGIPARCPVKPVVSRSLLKLSRLVRK
jgi:hypothetical protein